MQTVSMRSPRLIRRPSPFAECGSIMVRLALEREYAMATCHIIALRNGGSAHLFDLEQTNGPIARRAIETAKNDLRVTDLEIARWRRRYAAERDDRLRSFAWQHQGRADRLFTQTRRRFSLDDLFHEDMSEVFAFLCELGLRMAVHDENDGLTVSPYADFAEAGLVMAVFAFGLRVDEYRDWVDQAIVNHWRLKSYERFGR